MSIDEQKKAWVVLLTRSNYLAATILLHYSLQRLKSKYPLYVLVTPTLPQSSKQALKDAGCPLIEVDVLRPQVEVSVVAERFADTWDKLRAFGLEGFDRVVMLDADMLIMQNMDELFEMELPRDWIAANHACSCNWSRDKWALDDWRPWNCPWTHAQITGELTPSYNSKPTHALLNSGMVVLHPSPKLLDEMIEYLHTSPLVKTFSFPDQDFLTNYYQGKWKNVGWTYNAIKTARYWHPKLWRDAEVRNLHYIVAKPWTTPVEKWTAAEGDDRITHGWWWHMWYEYKKQDGTPASVIEECEKNMLGPGVEVGPVESWEESVKAEAGGRERNGTWPPGKPWGVTVDGVEY